MLSSRALASNLNPIVVRKKARKGGLSVKVQLNFKVIILGFVRGLHAADARLPSPDLNMQTDILRNKRELLIDNYLVKS